MISRRVLAAIAGLVLATGCASEAPTRAERVRALESRVWSPYCPGRLLTECSTSQSAELRAEITRRVARGDSDAEVVSWLRSNYGDEVLASPAGGARGTAIWLIPLLAFGLGALLVAVLIRRWTAPPAQEPPVEPVPAEETDGWIARVRQEAETDT